jgi:flagellar hook protein FlgE
MSLYGVMRTSTSGMTAQASRISSVAENVANANTVGYKSSRAEFSSVFIERNISSFNSGSVDTNIRRLVSQQGTLQATGSLTDLAIDGEGFFIVQDRNGSNLLTRAGSFLPDENGTLVNTAGFNLLGYPLTNSNPSIVVNGYAGLVPITINDVSLLAEASGEGMFAANLPSAAAAVPSASLPSSNSVGTQYTAKSSLVIFGNLGEEITIDLYFTKSGPSTWEVAAYAASDSAPGTTFPYSSGPLASGTLAFDPLNGQLANSSINALSIPVPGGQNLSLDMAAMTQLATDYMVLDARVDGNAASAAEIVEISNDGFVYVAFADGTRRPIFRVPLATVSSPDNLESISGNAFATTSGSGDVRIGFPGETDLGSTLSGVLEQSTTDIASEFTDMIDAQRSYTANSKVFQTGAELMDVLVNLKR